MSKKAKLKNVKLPQIKVSGSSSITIFEIGNIAHGLLPSTEELQRYSDLIKEATKNKNSSVFVPAGLVRVTQYTL